MNEEDKIIFQRLIYYNDEEHLAKRIIELQHYNEDLQQELQRKDNIINELKKWLEDYIKLFDSPDILEEQTLEDLKEVLDKINELEGEVNEKSND